MHNECPHRFIYFIGTNLILGAVGTLIKGQEKIQDSSGYVFKQSHSHAQFGISND